MPEVLEIWAASQTDHITSQWWSKSYFIINGHYLRSINGHLLKPCARLDGPRGEMEQRGSGKKTLDEDIALPRENIQRGRGLKGGEAECLLMGKMEW